MTLIHGRLPRIHQRQYPAVIRMGPSGSDYVLEGVSALQDNICRALHAWPAEIDLASAAGRATVTARLARALRAQRRHAITGHWAYDFSCHANLLTLHRRVAQSGAIITRSASWSWPASAHGGCQGPSSLPAQSGRGHNWARPSGSRAAIPISRGILPATADSGSAGAALAT
jgi:hypothetical protein